MSSSGLKKVKGQSEEGQDAQNGLKEGQVKSEKPKWKELVADLSIILSMFPGDVAMNLTLFQAVEIKKAEHRRLQFEAGIHGVKLPDADTPRTEDGRTISSVDDLFGAMKAGMK